MEKFYDTIQCLGLTLGLAWLWLYVDVHVEDNCLPHLPHKVLQLLPVGGKGKAGNTDAVLVLHGTLTFGIVLGSWFRSWTWLSLSVEELHLDRLSEQE